MGMYTAVGISYYVVDKCMCDGLPISNLQLQKILYYLQKKFLQNHSSLFEDDFVAWQFGPVIEDVYYNYCIFGSMPIRRRYIVDVEQKIKRIIDPIIEEKRRLNPWEMVHETHKKNGAWYTVYSEGNGNGKIIPKSLIASRG